jgi:hypothetical protein
MAARAVAMVDSSSQQTLAKNEATWTTTISVDRMPLAKENDPNGTRTRVTGVKGRCPRPLDDGASAYG